MLSYTKRKIVFTRDEFTCHYCGKPASKVYEYRSARSGNKLIVLEDPENYFSFVIDHKVPRCNGGSNDLENLITSCSRCNGRKGSKRYEDFVNELINEGAKIYAI